LFFNRVAIVGIGLLGGSIGLALKAGGLCGQVVGVGRSRASIEDGLKVGAIDDACDEPCEAAAAAELVVVCTPVGSVAGIVAEMESRIDDDCIVTDVGSTKLEIIRGIEQLPRAAARFVGSHPMAGSEKKGVRYASADLFDGANVFITPTAATDPAVAATVGEMWERFGGRVTTLDPAAHDRVVARTSHLPHIAASLLVANLRVLDEENKGGLLGKGFLDATRIASSDSEMWADICVSNPEQIREAIGDFCADLEEFEKLLDDCEYEKILEFFRSIKLMRDSLGKDVANG
jgi:prephenate dehydrogenase